MARVYNRFEGKALREDEKISGLGESFSNSSRMPV
ncbi:hypothetical protein HRbin02_00499 [Candidatus Calditenuaceae archaeon HR02]|nr:hypothetical protein HRbin02_00499 [Candidatus Calditenuaceae archaeon HR02]